MLKSYVRTGIVGLVAVALLALPGAASASAPTKATTDARVCTRGAVPATKYETHVKFLGFDKTRPFGSTTAIRGQVTVRVGSATGSLPGAKVKLYRKPAGSSHWGLVGSKRTPYPSSHPKFDFRLTSRGNAHYRVVFESTTRCKRSAATTGVSVYRQFHAKLKDGVGRFHGRVTPHYAHKTIYLEKRPCASCGWHRFKTAKTGDRGRWSFKVGAPSRGRWWWRASTPASTRFITSYSAVFTTRQAR